MIEFVKGDLFDSGAEALVNAVNCVGVMGGGIAYEFKHRFPKNYEIYKRACKDGIVRPGGMSVTVEEDGTIIINFPTKDHYKHPSRIEYIKSGLNALVDAIGMLDIKSIAIPALGCGLGGLLWSDVKPLIVNAFNSLPHVTVYLYEPRDV